MKKLLMMLLSIMLVVAMTLSLAACGESGKKVEDETETTAAAEKEPAGTKAEEPKETDPVETEPEETEPAETEPAEDTIVGEWIGYMDATELLGLGIEIECRISMDFQADGTVVLTAYTKEMAEDLLDSIDEILDAMAEEAGLTVDDVLEAMGVDKAEFAEMLAEEMGELENETEEGEYTYENGVLTVEGNEVGCEIDGDKMSIELDDDYYIDMERK